MIRGTRLRTAMTWLSLTAVLLLALLPSIGRLASAYDVDGPRTIVMEMCTMAGGAHVSMVDPFELRDAPPPAPAAHGDMADCAYCPLLATALMAMLWLVYTLLVPAPRATARRCARASVRHPCGLGSRGPPLAA
ncbi:hypothetical protein CMZ84_06405 [Lysobacteraceae bacterium NML93-0399]|nr:hypothetical protein CMZ84_06405 [Xanthomonadaceae bacterium NML93-0399]